MKSYNRPDHHKFRGDIFEIKWKKIYPYKEFKHELDAGERITATTLNTKKDKVITIDPDMIEDEEYLLIVLIDEALHACFWDLDNDSVAEASTSIAKFLKKIGFTLKK